MPPSPGKIPIKIPRQTPNTKYKKCVSILEKALKEGHEVKELYNNLGIAYYATKDNVSAKEMFEQAIKIDPDYVHATDNLKNINKSE